MTTKDFTINLPSNQSASDVFKAVTQVKKWWSGFYEEEINGKSSKLNDEFTFRAGNGVHFSKQKLIEVVQDKRVVWLVTESKLTFLKKTDEWTGTKIIFDIIEKGGKVSLQFTHSGLHPKIECYTSCAPAWEMYLKNKLLPMINSKK